MRTPATCRLACAFLLLGVINAHSFDYAGHRIVNQVALAGLPDEFPSFVNEPAAAERIAFLAGEPDRWRNSKDPGLQHANKPDHYLDVEYLKPLGFDVHALPPFRYQFVMQLGEARKQHGNQYPTVNPDSNRDHTQELVGFLPWSIDEWYAKVQSAFSALKAFEEAGGTPEEIRNAQENAIYCMGVLGHYVGDAAQPLHTTMYFNGWVGANPHGYTTSHSFHSWIDGGFVKATGIELKDVLPLVKTVKPLRDHPGKDNGVFGEAMDYILEQHKLVEPLYQLEKDGGLSPGGPKSGEGRAFIKQRFLAGGTMLSRLWLTAWKEAPVDTYLKASLERRK